MRRTYRWNNETQELEELTAPVEWVISGTRYGAETLEHMRKNGLVPTSDFTNHWAKHQAEKERVYRLGQGDLSQMRRDEGLRRQISDAIDRVRAGHGELGSKHGRR